MKIAIGADHGGFQLKKRILDFLDQRGYHTTDFGSDSPEPCDYPRFAYKVAKAVSEGKADLGVLICKSGNGMAVVANKLPGVRAAICFDKDVAALSRQHNDANVMVLGSEHVLDHPESILQSWLDAAFEGGRHKRRVDQIMRIEDRVFKARRPKRKPTQSEKRKAKSEK